MCVSRDQSQSIQDLTTFAIAWVSLNRINEFFLAVNIRSHTFARNVTLTLFQIELLDQFNDATQVPTDNVAAPISGTQTEILSPVHIGIKAAEFKWSREQSAPSATTGQGATFTLSVIEELEFKPGSFTLVIGPTGSGKTSLLMALQIVYYPTARQNLRMRSFHLPLTRIVSLRIHDS